jgi:hypothetical protein
MDDRGLIVGVCARKLQTPLLHATSQFVKHEHRKIVHPPFLLNG